MVPQAESKFKETLINSPKCYAIYNRCALQARLLARTARFASRC